MNTLTVPADDRVLDIDGEHTAVAVAGVRLDIIPADDRVLDIEEEWHAAEIAPADRSAEVPDEVRVYVIPGPDRPDTTAPPSVGAGYGTGGYGTGPYGGIGSSYGTGPYGTSPYGEGT